MKKTLPKLASDQQAEDFVDTADLSQYDLSVMKPRRFEFAQKAAPSPVPVRPAAAAQRR